MNMDQIEGKWDQLKGKVQEKWGKLTNDDLHVISGKREQLVGKIQERYGMLKDKAEKEVDNFLNDKEYCSTDSKKDPKSKDSCCN